MRLGNSSQLRTWGEAHLSPAVAVGIAIVGVLTVSLGDLLTGPYLVFATFYLIPVALAAWFAGRNAALWIAAFAAVAGIVSTAMDPGEVTSEVYWWNGLFRFITYAIVGVILSAEREAMATIHALASTDPLTGLMNRRSFYEQAEREMARARRDGRPLAVIYIDVDDLKARNDTYGHEAGDAMLVEFADASRRISRSTDLAARLGGDEFGFLLPHADMSEAATAVERLRADLMDSGTVPISFSAGILAGTVAGKIEIEDLVRSADLLMIEAKTAGKARTVSRPTLTSD